MIPLPSMVLGQTPVPELLACILCYKTKLLLTFLVLPLRLVPGIHLIVYNLPSNLHLRSCPMCHSHLVNKPYSPSLPFVPKLLPVYPPTLTIITCRVKSKKHQIFKLPFPSQSHLTDSSIPPPSYPHSKHQDSLLTTPDFHPFQYSH